MLVLQKKMQARPLLIIVLLVIPFYLFAQTGIIAGKITDAGNNQALVGATVIISNTVIKTLADIDGQYRISNLQKGNYTLEVSYVGYSSKQITNVEVINNQVTSLNIVLEPLQNNTLQAVVVTTEARKESINALLITRKNAAVVSDAISADMIRRSPDKNVGDVLKRISGTTIQENKFVVIRGMNDRYNEAMLGRALLPSTEADRKTFAYDIFPSELIENLTIIKTALPEYPGSFAGGLVQVNLKEVPDKNFFSFKAGSGLNTITANKTFYHQDNGGLDFIGLDDGTRALPNNMPSSQDYNALSPQKREKWAKKFPNDWPLRQYPSGPYNAQIQLAGAVTTKPKNNYPRFGALFALGYNSTFRNSEVINRDYGAVTVLPDSVDKGTPYYDYKDTSSTHNILSSALANFTLKLNGSHKIFFNNLATVNSTIQTIVRGGQSQAGTGVLSPYYAYVHYFQSNVLYNGQLGGEHYLNKYKLRVKWLIYQTNFHRNEPDYRQMIYFTPFENSPMYAYLGYPTVSSTTVGGIRFYYDTKNLTRGINIDVDKTFHLFGNPQTLKFGFAQLWDDRIRDGRFLRNDPSDINFNQKILSLPPGKIFAQKNFNYQTGLVLTDFNEKQWYYYKGDQQNTAGYVMFDNRFTQKIRMAWGLRVENYSNYVRSFQEGNTKYKVDSTFLDFMPSANFIYSVLPKANLRVSYSHTNVRPLYREIAATQFYDFLLNAIFYGASLTETDVDNYEIRWEQYFNNAQYYSASVFYKKFKNPIEQKIAISGADSKTITWQNAPAAEAQGIELEARKNLDFITPALSQFYLYGNAAFIKSTAFVKGNGSDSVNRPMQGQSPYVFNASLQYSDSHTGINVSALYNVIGARIFLVGGTQEPYIWEKPHAQLDFKISKTFLKNGLAEFSLSDILHQNDNLFWDLNGNKKYDAGYPDVLIQSRSFGMNINLSIGYRF